METPTTALGGASRCLPTRCGDGDGVRSGQRDVRFGQGHFEVTLLISPVSFCRSGGFLGGLIRILQFSRTESSCSCPAPLSKSMLSNREQARGCWIRHAFWIIVVASKYLKSPGVDFSGCVCAATRFLLSLHLHTQSVTRQSARSLNESSS